MADSQPPVRWLILPADVSAEILDESTADIATANRIREFAETEFNCPKVHIANCYIMVKCEGMT